MRTRDPSVSRRRWSSRSGVFRALVPGPRGCSCPPVGHCLSLPVVHAGPWVSEGLVFTLRPHPRPVRLQVVPGRRTKLSLDRSLSLDDSEDKFLGPDPHPRSPKRPRHSVAGLVRQRASGSFQSHQTRSVFSPFTSDPVCISTTPLLFPLSSLLRPHWFRTSSPLTLFCILSCVYLRPQPCFRGHSDFTDTHRGRPVGVTESVE